MKKILKNKFLIMRRFSQLLILGLFFVANCSFFYINEERFFASQSSILSFEQSGKNIAITAQKKDLLPIKILNGNLSMSKILDIIPLTDPLAFLQIFLAGGAISMDVLLGLGVVLLIYGLFFGRGYCAFVCPMNMVTDLAAYLRHLLDIPNIHFLGISRKSKFAILALLAILSYIFSALAWEIISPISMLHRGIIFGMGSGFFGVLIVFLLDLCFMKNGFCGHLCPLGASYSLIGIKSIIHIKHNSKTCTKCMECVKICPESQVLSLIGKKSHVVNGIDCIKCGRCVEVCNDDALNFSITNIKEKI